MDLINIDYISHFRKNFFKAVEGNTTLEKNIQYWFYHSAEKRAMYSILSVMAGEHQNVIELHGGKYINIIVFFLFHRSMGGTR